MTMQRRRATLCTLSLVLSLGLGCERATPSSEFWRAGERYELRITVDERPVQPSEVPVPSVDSLRVIIVIDSAAHDSLYGRYEGALDSLGVFTGDQSTSPHLVALRARPDSFTLILAPNVMDAQIFMKGAVRDGVGAGSWRQLAPAAPAGRFRVSKLSP